MRGQRQIRSWRFVVGAIVLVMTVAAAGRIARPVAAEPTASATGTVAAGERRVRRPVVAGQFYPADPQELYGLVAGFLAKSPGAGLRGVHAILVPHAGYVYSGEVAAASFREVDPRFRRVFLLAGNHNGEADFAGVALPDETHYAIPGAEIPLSPVLAQLRGKPPFTREPRAHTMHMIEVELPFLQQLRGRPQPPDYEIVPMIVGRLDEKGVDALTAVLDSYADAQTLFVFSVDLSHFYTGDKARQLDGYTVESIMSRDREAVRRAVTDADQVLDTMLALAARRGWEPTRLMARNSGDVTGDYGRVVGYAAVAFHDPVAFSEEEKRELLALARRSIETHLRGGTAPAPDAAWLERHRAFRIPRGVFVTLEKHGELRGCIGDLLPSGPLHQGVVANAVSAAVKDPRFPPVKMEELAELAITISVLDYPSRVKVGRPEEYLKVLRPNLDGVILTYQGRRSTFLPEVWKQIPDPEEFLARLSVKQGSPADAWRDPSAVLYRYGAYIFGEESSPLSTPGATEKAEAPR